MNRTELQGEYRDAFEYFKKKYQDRNWEVMPNHEAEGHDIEALAIHFSTDDERVSWGGMSIHNPTTTECGRFDFDDYPDDKEKFYGMSREDAMFMNYVNECLWALGDIERYERIRRDIVDNWSNAHTAFAKGVTQWDDMESGCHSFILETMGDEAQVIFDKLFKFCIAEWSNYFLTFIELWDGLLEKIIEQKKKEMKPNWKYLSRDDV